MLKKVSVAAVWQAAQLVAASAEPVPGHVLTDLDTSIRVRKEVASLYTREYASDPNHLHFIDVLAKAREVLRAVVPAPPPAEGAASPIATAPAADSPATLPNSFAGLAVEDSHCLTEVVPTAPLFTPGLTGAAVRIHGLAKKPELNGTIGYAQEYIQETGRYQVREGCGWLVRLFWAYPSASSLATAPCRWDAPRPK